MTAAGDRFEHLARTVGPAVLAYLARRTRPVEDAADVYSVVLTTTWRRLRVVPADDREAFGWMLGVARRSLANHRRGLCRRAALDERLRAQVSVAVRPAPDDATDQVRDLLARLDPRDRELVLLVHWEGLTTLEAAEVLGLSHAAARKRMQRLRQALHEQRDTVDSGS